MGLLLDANAHVDFSCRSISFLIIHGAVFEPGTGINSLENSCNNFVNSSPCPAKQQRSNFYDGIYSKISIVVIYKAAGCDNVSQGQCGSLKQLLLWTKVCYKPPWCSE